MEAYSELYQTPKMEFFGKNSYQLSAVNYFRKNLHLSFDWVLNTPRFYANIILSFSCINKQILWGILKSRYSKNIASCSWWRGLSVQIQARYLNCYKKKTLWSLQENIFCIISVKECSYYLILPSDLTYFFPIKEGWTLCWVSIGCANYVDH